MNPSHVVAQPGDRYALCGVRDPLPVVAAEFVDAHVAGYGMEVCADCCPRHIRDDNQ